jgi:kynurenine formamidase
MSTFIDLTVPWGPEIQPLEGHPRVSFEPITTHEHERRSNTQVTFSIHTGTHIDSPYHFYPEAAGIDEIALDTFIGPARVIDLTAIARSGQAISRADLQDASGDSRTLRGKRVLLRTDWATRHWNQPDLYTDNPFLSREAAQWLGDQEIRAVGLDFAVDQAFPYPNHYVFLGKSILLMENLIHLGDIPEGEFTLIALPLKVVHGDGGPARVVAWIP